MLKLKPNCELCDIDLPPDSEQAMICTYECTFCVNCVTTRLNNVCPNCGGDLCPRPVRPAREHRPGVSLSHQPASVERVHTRFSDSEIDRFTGPIAALKPGER
jgi:hypothetical protein